MIENILEMEEYAKEHNVPIMERDGLRFLVKYIKKNKVKKILEVGTAIGYSAINMALSDKDIEVTTIEKDEKRYIEAIKNIKKCGLEKQITLVLADAKSVNLEEKYDLIFIKKT